VQELEFHLYSMEASYCLAISPINADSVAQFAELLSIFGHYKDDDLFVRPEHVMTQELKEKVRAYCDRYEERNPVLNKFKKSISNIAVGNHFFVFAKEISSNIEVVCLYNYLNTRNMKLPEQDFIETYNNSNVEHLSILGALIEHYHIDVSSVDTRTHIGKSDRSERICRFCGKSTAVGGVTFKKIAHAIPEALGNKGLILNEECDDCNERFGNTIEQDLISYFNFHRVFWAIKGKNGVPKISFKNGYFERKENKFVIGYKPGPSEGAFKDLKEVTLVSHDRIATVNIYKSLCKIAISVIDADKLRHFGRTISWLLADELCPQVLPKVAILNAPQMRVECPQIVLYHRQSAQENLPHLVGEFKFKTLLLVFIVPFSDLDTKTFSSDEEYSEFWESFPNYTAVDGWKFKRFDSPQKRDYLLTVGLTRSITLRLCEDPV